MLVYLNQIFEVLFNSRTKSTKYSIDYDWNKCLIISPYDISISIFKNEFHLYLVIGGLLSAHLLAKRMNVPVNSTWPCTGPLLDLAIALADKLLPGKKKN